VQVAVESEAGTAAGQIHAHEFLTAAQLDEHRSLIDGLRAIDQTERNALVLARRGQSRQRRASAAMTTAKGKIFMSATSD